jgi:AcrR family transcriptional regulator
LDIACEIFLEHGYADTSMSMIAAKVGGSKATLYGYFSAKEEIFRAVVEHQSHTWSDSIFGLVADAGSLTETLRSYGEHMLDIVLSDRFLAFHRLVSGESARFPDVGRTYYQACVRFGLSHLASYLTEAMDAGLLRPADPMFAAEYLNDMCQAGLFRRRIFNVVAAPSRAEVKAHVGTAVDLFMRGFAPEPAMAGSG